MADRSLIVVPLCPICERPMKVERGIKRFFGLPEQKHFECQRCAVIARFAEPRGAGHHAQ
jgi:hypothetical protein